MAIFDSFQPTRLGSRRQVTFFRRNLLRSALLLAAALTPACSAIERANDSKLTLDTPIGWWHDLEGGKIAELRPPPPGVFDPYPNLGQVPAPPVMTDAATRHALAVRLAAERDRTRREATQDPLVLPAASVAPNIVRGAGGSAKPAASSAPAATAPPPDPGASMAVMDAATAPALDAAPATTPALPTISAVPPVPIAPAATAQPGAPSPQARAPAETPLQSAAELGPLPDVPIAEPALPRLGGLPASVNAPAVPRVPPPVTIAFRPGSATLPAAADAALRELAGRRAGAEIAVYAGGDAPGSGFEAQAHALPLALRRAQAMQAALVAAGVPAAALHIDAAATGRSGAARLLQQ